MPLPVLQNAGPTDRDLLRLFCRTELHWTQSLADESALECGTAFANPALAPLPAANRLLDAALTGEATAETAFAEVENHFAQHGSRCLEWIFNPAAPPAAVEPLMKLLIARGWRSRSTDILLLQSMPPVPATDLTIIPARASFRHMQMLAEQIATERGMPRLADAVMLHLDDPHWDALLALSGNDPVGTIGVLAVGDIGRIDQLFVSHSFRRRGIGATLLSRAMEICARSLFKHVMLTAKPDDAALRALLARLHFRAIGQIIAYQSPALTDQTGHQTQLPTA